MNDKARTIGYWVATGLLGFAFAAGGLGDLSRSPEVMEGMTHLGYPAYFATILGVWKVLGAVALLVPRFPRLKEWAYAGIIFDLTGAAVSHAASGDPTGKVITPLVLVAIAAASWALRPESRKLASEPKREAEARIAKPALAT
ncbi:DoxX family protein [Polyangium mundeleinium]|uniref:DoxX family protein n=1 Tax=Polyangium mundeleinium TaxID=2995306 RepID=A0ABT5EFN8_9BACT|nr:DoxX family protein [Polyangium mundeleinium]MDC0740630.1 DoxX family protein [Polyangium mundeleinium]